MPTNPTRWDHVPQPPLVSSPPASDLGDLMQTSPLTRDLEASHSLSDHSGVPTGGGGGGGRPSAKFQPLPPLSPAATEDRLPPGPARSPIMNSSRRPSWLEREPTGASSARGQTNSLSSSPSHYADSTSVSQAIPTPRQVLSARASSSLMGGFYSPRYHTPGGLIMQGTPRHSDPNSGSFNAGSAKPRALSFQLGRIVGTGGFGVVYQAILSDGTVAAVKEMKLDTTNTRAIDREVEIMSNLPPHPHCVRYFGSRHSRHHYYIIMEYISAGSIQSLRQQMGPFRESVFQRYAFMILLGLDHLHQNSIIHRDIKGANVLLDERGSPKIVDFGCCKNLNQLNSTLGGGGTPLWMAPEVCRGGTANEKTDVWSFGCLCLEMTNSTGLPWSFPPDTTIQGLAYAIACATQPPQIPDGLSAEAHNFIECCLQINPDERLSVVDLLEHPFFDMDYLQGTDDDENELIASRGGSLIKSTMRHRRRDQDEGDTDVMNSVTLNLRVVNSSDESSEGSDEEEVLVMGNMHGAHTNSSFAAGSPSMPSKATSTPRVQSGSLQLHTNGRRDEEDAGAAHALHTAGVGATPLGDGAAETGFRLTNIDTESDEEAVPAAATEDWVSSTTPSLAQPSLHNAQGRTNNSSQQRATAPKPQNEEHMVDVGIDEEDDQLVARLVALACSSGERSAKLEDVDIKLGATPLGLREHRPSISSGETLHPGHARKHGVTPGTSSSFDTEVSDRQSVPAATVQRTRRPSRDSDSDSSSEPDLVTTTDCTDDDDAGGPTRAQTAAPSKVVPNPVSQTTRVAREDARRHSDLVDDIFSHGTLPSCLATPEPSAADYGSATDTFAPKGAAQSRNPSWLFRTGGEQGQNVTTAIKPPWSAGATRAAPVIHTNPKVSHSGALVVTAHHTGNGEGVPSRGPPRGVSGDEAAAPAARHLKPNPKLSRRGSAGPEPELHDGPIDVVPRRSAKQCDDDDAPQKMPLGDDGMIWLTGGADRVSKTPSASAARGSVSVPSRSGGPHERSLSHTASNLTHSTSGTQTLSAEESQEGSGRPNRVEKKRSGVMAKLLRKQ